MEFFIPTSHKPEARHWLIFDCILLDIFPHLNIQNVKITHLHILWKNCLILLTILLAMVWNTGIVVFLCVTDLLNYPAWRVYRFRRNCFEYRPGGAGPTESCWNELTKNANPQKSHSNWLQGLPFTPFSVTEPSRERFAWTEIPLTVKVSDPRVLKPPLKSNALFSFH